MSNFEAVTDRAERLRDQFRPQTIKVLFVGESAPAGGTFFYAANSQVYRGLREVLGPHLQGSNFLLAFQDAGFFLDDLSAVPVNWNTASERRAIHMKNIPSLAQRLQIYQPEAVVAIMRAIEPAVARACQDARLSIMPRAIAFPGNGRQNDFRRDMNQLIPELKRIVGL